MNTKTTTIRKNRLANMAILMELTYRETIILPTFLTAKSEKTGYSEEQIMRWTEEDGPVTQDLANELKRIAATIVGLTITHEHVL